MRRLAPAVLAAAALLAGCGSDEPTPAAQGNGELANLTVTVDSDGEQGAPAKQLELNCKAPTDSAACGAAAGVSTADLAPTPKDQACTQIFGGPETASIKGTIRGNAVDATFSRSDGCEIARWERVEDLLAEVR
jgi:hypothetical protein